MNTLEPLPFRIPPLELLEALGEHLGDRLPSEYRQAGTNVSVNMTPDGLDVVFGAPKKPTWWLQQLLGGG